ncbi:hypothetical protein O181_008665 [Austropuccinia psidii MF-1]|uniref:DUF4939 domain-containing protein n=1 Tax=Austropuccinia psidii MF-1 TaxID=1389203 RepID=A0A9Q3BPT2_9BASI|nr:hypothetical protein [Austropuccinia psidii MF-1]
MLKSCPSNTNLLKARQDLRPELKLLLLQLQELLLMAPQKFLNQGPNWLEDPVPGEDGEEEEENSVEKEEPDGTEGAPAPVGVPQGTGGPTLAHSDQPVSHHSEQSLLAIMQQMTQITANIQEASSSESSNPPAFKTPSIKAQECFDGTEPFKVRSFIWSCQLIFHNYLANFSQERKKVLYATSFLIGRAANWIEPYLSNLTN